MAGRSRVPSTDRARLRASFDRNNRHNKPHTDVPAPANATDPAFVHRLNGPTHCSCGGLVHESDTTCSNGGNIAA